MLSCQSGLIHAMGETVRWAVSREALAAEHEKQEVHRQNKLALTPARHFGSRLRFLVGRRLVARDDAPEIVVQEGRLFAPASADASRISKMATYDSLGVVLRAPAGPARSSTKRRMPNHAHIVDDGLA